MAIEENKKIELHEGMFVPPSPSLPDDDEELIDGSEPLKNSQKDRYDIITRGLMQKLVEREEIHDMRKDHAERLFCVIISWLFSVGLMIGYLVYANISIITQTVLITIITTTTASVLALYAIAAKWLFKSPDANTSKTNS